MVLEDFSNYIYYKENGSMPDLEDKTYIKNLYKLAKKQRIILVSDIEELADTISIF